MPIRSLLLLALAALLPAAEPDALAISRSIAEQHLPFGTVLDPEFGTNGQSIEYHRCGDSALWTAHYLAAEAFRYRVTHSVEARQAILSTLDGLASLVEVTGNGLLARCLVPVDSRFAPGILSEEASNGSFRAAWRGREYHWIGNTSRDQYVGFFYGLGIAYSIVEDAGIRARITAIATPALDYLLGTDWVVRMPDGKISTVFWHRPDQQLMLLAVGRHVNPRRFDSKYRSNRLFKSISVIPPVAIEVLDDHNSYFKFNLDYLSLYTLLRLDSSSPHNGYYREAYDILRRTTDGHGNAQFHMLDRALNGPRAGRDEETRMLLDQWLRRPRRDEWVDLRAQYGSCDQEDKACVPISIVERVRTDYLWQRSPFLLYGGGSGRIASPGIDYILPYWMARFYGVLSE